MNCGYIQITRRCNQRCIICSNPDRDATLTVNEVTGLMDRLLRDGYDGVILTGGEPTLHPDLPEMLKYSRKLGLDARIITNGQGLGNASYLAKLVDAGLGLIHLSVLSHIPALQCYLSGNTDSHEGLLKAMDALNQSEVSVAVNIPVCHFNARTLPQMIRWVLSRLPSVFHFSFDLLDPMENRATENPHVVPSLWAVRAPLARTFRLLSDAGISFRMERLPLCLMAEDCHLSTEARKIAKREDRRIHFLDEKGEHTEIRWRYHKPPCCSTCSLDALCPGLWEMGRAYSENELCPQTMDVATVLGRMAREP